MTGQGPGGNRTKGNDTDQLVVSMTTTPMTPCKHRLLRVPVQDSAPKRRQEEAKDLRLVPRRGPLNEENVIFCADVKDLYTDFNKNT